MPTLAVRMYGAGGEERFEGVCKTVTEDIPLLKRTLSQRH